MQTTMEKLDAQIDIAWEALYRISEEAMAKCPDDAEQQVKTAFEAIGKAKAIIRAADNPTRGW